ALVLVAIFTFFGALLLYKITDLIIPIRVSEQSELLGLDISQHNESLDPQAL
ncbi:MAG: ammonium transporter, partial [Flavobacteriales bacterium]|nr:ammonium transporter [Flavobacteriales bacterium]